LSIIFDLERTNQLNPLPDKDLVDLCPWINDLKEHRVYLLKHQEIQKCPMPENFSGTAKLSVAGLTSGQQEG